MNEHSGEPRHIGPSTDSTAEERTFVGGFIAPTLAVLFTLFWVLMQYWLIPNRERDWQFGTAPYIPGESAVVSRYDPSAVQGQKQVELPDRGAAGGGMDAAR